MKYDVFISYSTKDKEVADKVCRVLEKNGIRCWIAPRNIQPSKPYAREIINGITSSRVLLLICTSNSNKSEHVINEVDAAFNAKKAIIPFLVEDVTMNPELGYYLKRKHWLIAYPDYNQKLENLIYAICEISGMSKPEKVFVSDEDVAGEPVSGNEGNSDLPTSNFWDFFASSTFKVGFRYFVVLLIVVSVGVGAWSTFMVDNAPLESVSGENYIEQVSKSNRSAPDRVRGHRPASSPKESDSNGVTPESRTLEEYSSCPKCSGSGIKYDYDVINNMYMALPCPDCSGSGKLPDKQFKEQNITVNESFFNGRE